MARTQAERKAETRSRLLSAAAELFARGGLDGTSADTVADAADRTAGSVYAHFGSKAGLVLALLDEMKDEAAAAILADVARAETTDERIGALWRNFADPPADLEAWVLLEHELWLYAARNSDEGGRLAQRYETQRALLAEGIHSWAGSSARSSHDTAVLVLAMLLGLEMQRRLDPQAVPDELAVDALRQVLTARDGDSEHTPDTHPPELTGSFRHGAD